MHLRETGYNTLMITRTIINEDETTCVAHRMTDYCKQYGFFDFPPNGNVEVGTGSVLAGVTIGPIL